MTRRPTAARFDAGYYRRYYEDSATAVVNRTQQRNEVRFVLSFCRLVGLGIARFADVGAGTGWWARELARQYPGCRRIETYDASPDACRLYGHRLRSAEDVAGHPADLVVCRDVLRYLPDARARRAIRALERKCRGVLYLHVVSREDEIDEEASDMSGWFRPVRWYRDALADAGFTDAGMGLFVSRRLESFDPFAIEAR